MYIATCSRRLIAVLISAVLSGAIAGCSLEEQSAPAFTGPSEFAMAVTLSVDRDSLPRDGSSQAIITVTWRDASNNPVAGRLSIATNIGTLSQNEIVTDSDGHAAFAFTAPAAATVGNSAQIQVVPISVGGDAALPRVLTIALTGTSNSTVPSPAFTVTPTAPEKSTSVRFDASTTTDEGAACLDACTYNWNFGDGSSGTGRITSHTFTSPGTFNVTLTVTDAAGTSASTATAVTVSNVAAPTVALAVAPNPPLADQPATFTATATPATGHGISTYFWTFGDGAERTTTGPTTTKTYSAVGTYVITVKVTDDLGQTASASLSFTIVGSGVTASFTSSPTDPTTATAVQFNGIASTAPAGATIADYEWDFGDGSSVSGSSATASNTFAAVGTYVVRLTVTDSAGRTGTTTANVTVAAPAVAAPAP